MLPATRPSVTSRRSIRNDIAAISPRMPATCPSRDVTRCLRSCTSPVSRSSFSSIRRRYTSRFSGCSDMATDVRHSAPKHNDDHPESVLAGKGGKSLHPAASSTAADWRDDIFAVLQAAGIRQVGYVPDAGHARLIELCRADPQMRAIVLTSEEEGIGLAAGAWLGGQRAALLMQSSGVGNCINMLSLAKSCRFPLVMLVTMRGEWAEFNPWQVPMGSNTQAALELCDVLVYRVDRPEEAAETVAAALDIAFNGDLATAVLLSQRMIGVKRWVK